MKGFESKPMLGSPKTENPQSSHSLPSIGLGLNRREKMRFGYQPKKTNKTGKPPQGGSGVSKIPDAFKQIEIISKIDKMEIFIKNAYKMGHVDALITRDCLIEDLEILRNLAKS